MNAKSQKKTRVEVFVKTLLEVIHVAVHLECTVMVDSFVKKNIRAVLLPFSKVSGITSCFIVRVFVLMSICEPNKKKI